jgi:hypothetical protein
VRESTIRRRRRNIAPLWRWESDHGSRGSSERRLRHSRAGARAPSDSARKLGSQTGTRIAHGGGTSWSLVARRYAPLPVAASTMVTVDGEAGHASESEPSTQASTRGSSAERARCIWGLYVRSFLQLAINSPASPTPVRVGASGGMIDPGGATKLRHLDDARAAVEIDSRPMKSPPEVPGSQARVCWVALR